jgi:hypothetical protein
MLQVSLHHVRAPTFVMLVVSMLIPWSLQDYLTLPKRQALDSSALGWQQEGRRIGRRAQASTVGVLLHRSCDSSEAIPTCAHADCSRAAVREDGDVCGYS